MPNLGEKARRLESYWSLANLLWTTAITGSSLMLGWLAAALAWAEGTIKPFGTIGYIVTALVVALLLGGIFLAISVGVWFWRRDKSTTPSAQRKLPEAIVAEEGPPESPKDLIAYNDLVAFAIDYLIPACFALDDLQGAIVGGRSADAHTAWLAKLGLRHNYKTEKFWQACDDLHAGLCESPGPIISMDRMIEYIHEIELTYKSAMDFTYELSGASPGNPIDKPEWKDWKQKHNLLVDEYERIKRDARFGKLFRPARNSRWGGMINAG